MGVFSKHTAETAPAGAAEVLAKVKAKYGFIPNLASFVAEAPGVLDAIMGLSNAFDKTSFAPREQQLVLLTVSVMNGCEYCRTVHKGMGRKAGLDDATIRSAFALEPLPDTRLNALRDFTASVVKDRGWVAEETVEEFLDAGFTKAQVFEVVLGVGMKTITNYCNHLAGAKPNPEFVAMAEGVMA